MVGLPDLGTDVGADELVTDTGGADVIDLDAGDLGFRQQLRLRKGRRQTGEPNTKTAQQ
jgi:hypothetical protein